MKTLTVMSLLIVLALSVHSQTSDTPKSGNENSKAANVNAPGTFIDINKNGICDNFEGRHANGHGRNFVDNNGDGICDNRSKANVRGNGGRGNGTYCRYGGGHGMGTSGHHGYRFRHHCGGTYNSRDSIK